MKSRSARALREAALALLLRERPLLPFLAGLVVCAVGISWAVCIAMSLLLYGTIRPDYLLTGAVAALTAAPPMLGMLLLVISRLRELTAQLERLADTDPLTQVYNRRAFDSFLARETMRATRYGRPLSLLLLDLDSFKEINDTLGHSAGDRALMAAVAAVGALLRRSDLLFRIGGDEFAILLPETDLAGAADMGERIRNLQMAIEGPHSPKITLSCGGSQYMPSAAPETLVEAADRALYRAKDAGGDRVEMATRSSPGRGTPSRPSPLISGDDARADSSGETPS